MKNRAKYLAKHLSVFFCLTNILIQPQCPRYSINLCIMQIGTLLEKIGLDEKEIAIYLALLKSGPAPVRKIALDAKINRGTTYDILKGLLQLGVVSYFHQDQHKHFVCEDPIVLEKVLAEQRQSLITTSEELAEALPELRSMYARGDEKPVVRYYEAYRGVKTVLEDLIAVVAQQDVKEYAVYSSSTIRPYLHRAWPDFTKQRIAAGIRVKVIAIGEGGELHGLDQRRWLRKEEGAPTYTILYGAKIAMITVGENKEPRGIIIEDQAITSTQQNIFSALWKTLQ